MSILSANLRDALPGNESAWSKKDQAPEIDLGFNFGNLAIGVLQSGRGPLDFRSMALRPRLSAGLLLSCWTLVMFDVAYNNRMAATPVH